jgi:hypothetical protein
LAYFSPPDDNPNREILWDIRESDFPDIAIMRMAVAYFLKSYPDFSQRILAAWSSEKTSTRVAFAAMVSDRACFHRKTSQRAPQLGQFHPLK